MSELRDILESVAGGRLTVEQALGRLSLLQVARLGEFARLDVGRGLRKGVPEVVFAAGKGDGALAAIVRRFLEERGVALVTRLAPERAPALLDTLQDPGLTVRYDPDARILEAMNGGYRPPVGSGRIGLFTAGTADIPVAEEAALVARHMGCDVCRAYDVGVAGVHRLLEPLTEMMERGVDALVVVAGMEGALPSLVAALTDVPVIGVPTSTGYGFGGEGTGALASMLQSCSPGLVVVNIDNGVGAGAAAALIAARRGAPTEAPGCGQLRNTRG